MKVITANALRDGLVVYLDEAGQWMPSIGDAVLFSDDEAEEALAKALQREGDVADVYLIEATQDAKPAGRAALREAIRAAGPTVRLDLGKQAAV